ncbi:hypothetical protein [Oleiharenicola sp. Vm1]|uniref:hypothetical protein n=1 Tax=Oleiharenicola sp. Vm1 TaxID=3398393 RepID=UPI0039F4DC19
MNSRVRGIISVIPADDGGSGHYVPYAVAVGQAAQLNGWRHLGLVPKTIPRERIPAHWKNRLATWDETQPARFSKPLKFLRMAISLRSALSDLLTQANVVVLDPFSVLKLAALWLALLTLPRRECIVCLIYRYDSDTSRGELLAFRWLNRAFAIMMPNGRFLTLTDSEPLRLFLSEKFSRPVHVLPIPHTFAAVRKSAPASLNCCWWPGKPLENKGRAVLAQLVVAAVPHAESFVLRAARSAGWQAVAGGPAIELLPDRLTEEQYAAEMARADFILLPYAPAVYRRRTSGIFVEAVVAGKIPIVSAGTWAASELERHGLLELAWVDWNPLTTFTRLLAIRHNADLACRLQALRERYAAEHSISGYAATLKHLLT